MARSLFVFCFVLFCVAQALSRSTLEGTWTDSKYGGNLYICIDERWNVWASYSEAGVLWGKSTTDKTQAAGTWHEAGDAPCNHGTWEAYFADPNVVGGEALIFQFRCDNVYINQIVQRVETRKSSVANDEDCLIVYEEAQFYGSWGNRLEGIDWLDACDSGDIAEISTVYYGSPTAYLYANGTAFEDGRLFSGNYTYSNLINEDDTGYYMFFPTSATEAVEIYWSSVVPINYTLKDDPAIHALTRGIQFRDRRGNRCADNYFLTGYVSGAASLTVGFLMLIVVFVI